MTSEQAMRVERDSMGELRVPADAYYGAQTMRAALNFPISNLRFPRSFIRALGQGKAGMGTAEMTMNSRVAALADGGSEVTMASEVTVTGILAQLGRGMTQVVSKRMLQEFVGRLTRALENQA